MSNGIAELAKGNSASGLRKGGNSGCFPWFKISDLSSVQCFNNVGWMMEGHLTCKNCSSAPFGKMCSLKLLLNSFHLRWLVLLFHIIGLLH